MTATISRIIPIFILHVLPRPSTRHKVDQITSSPCTVQDNVFTHLRNTSG